MKTRLFLSLLFICTASVANAAVINQMSTNTFGGYSQTYGQYGRELMILGLAEDYFLDDGSSWNSGAGWHPTQYADLDNVYLDGANINYVLDMSIGSTLFQNTDYNSGNHSAQGVLATIDQLILTAEIGSTIASITGYAEILSNDETWYGEPRFNYYSANVGDFVHYDVEYRLLGGATWGTDIFDTQFSYNLSGLVDFTNIKSVPEPSSFVLFLVALPLLFLRRITSATRDKPTLRFCMPQSAALCDELKE